MIPITAMQQLRDELAGLAEKATPARWDRLSGWPFSPLNMAHKGNARMGADEELVCLFRNSLPQILAALDEVAAWREVDKRATAVMRAGPSDDRGYLVSLAQEAKKVADQARARTALTDTTPTRKETEQ